jgi:hypothetical protein
MIDLLILGGIVIAALLVMASGIWVAMELIREISRPG